MATTSAEAVKFRHSTAILILSAFDVLKRILYSDENKRKAVSGYLTFFENDALIISERIGPYQSGAARANEECSREFAEHLLRYQDCLTIREIKVKHIADPLGGHRQRTGAALRIGHDIVISFDSELPEDANEAILLLYGLFSGLLNIGAIRIFSQNSGNKLIGNILSFEGIERIKKIP